MSVGLVTIVGFRLCALVGISDCLVEGCEVTFTITYQFWKYMSFSKAKQHALLTTENLLKKLLTGTFVT